MSDIARLLEDAVGVIGGLSPQFFRADHLRVPGDCRQGVLELVRDAGGKLAEGGEVFF